MEDWEFAGCSFCCIIINNYGIYSLKFLQGRKINVINFCKWSIIIMDCAVQILYFVQYNYYDFYYEHAKTFKYKINFTAGTL